MEVTLPEGLYPCTMAPPGQEQVPLQLTDDDLFHAAFDIGLLPQVLALSSVRPHFVTGTAIVSRKQSHPGTIAQQPPH